MTDKNALVKRRSNPEKHKSKWSEIPNINKMKVFFGICIAMGILKLPEIPLYWQRKYSLFEIADWNQHMNRDRFLALALLKETPEVYQRNLFFLKNLNRCRDLVSGEPVVDWLLFPGMTTNQSIS